MIKVYDFKKLKQNDRIEFLLRKNEIDDNQINFGISRFIYSMSIIIGFILIISLLLYPISTESFLKIIQLIEPIGLILIWFTIIFCIGQIISNVITHKKHKELEKEFFKFEVKPRK